MSLWYTPEVGQFVGSFQLNLPEVFHDSSGLVSVSKAQLVHVLVLTVGVSIHVIGENRELRTVRSTWKREN